MLSTVLQSNLLTDLQQETRCHHQEVAVPGGDQHGGTGGDLDALKGKGKGAAGMCWKCNGGGHRSDQCTSVEGATMECWRCRGTGHMGRDCATPYGKGPTGPKGGGDKGKGGGKGGKGKGKDWGKGKGGWKGGKGKGVSDFDYSQQYPDHQWPVLPGQQPSVPYGPPQMPVPYGASMSGPTFPNAT